MIALGTDIVEIERIEASVKADSARLAKRILTPTELNTYYTAAQPERFLAKRFAAKEAAAKALGTGIGRGVSFQHIHISNNEFGAPQLHFTEGALDRFKQLNGQQAALSIADERHYAIATVIIS